MAKINFYDKEGKTYPFEGTKEQFDKWNTFGFKLAPTANTDTTGSGSQNAIVTPKGTTGDSSLTGGLGDGMVDGLTQLKISLRNMTDKYYKKGVSETSAGALKFFQDKGYDVSKLPGGFAGKIIDMVERQVSSNLQPQWDNMKDILSSIETNQNNAVKTAQSTINTMMDNKAWAQLTTEQRSKLWEAAGYPGKPVIPSASGKTLAELQKDVLSSADSLYAQFKDSADKTAFKKKAKDMLSTVYPELKDFISSTVDTLFPDGMVTKIEDLTAEERTDVMVMQHALDDGESDINDYRKNGVPEKLLQFLKLNTD